MMALRLSCDFLARVFHKHTISEMTGDCRAFKVLRCSVDGGYSMRFQTSPAQCVRGLGKTNN